LFAAFSQADNVLTTAAKTIAEIITMPGIINIDFADVKTVMQNSGAAVMGAATAGGDDRAIKAAEAALLSPLLNNTDIKGAQKILVSIMGSNMESISMDEFCVINDYFQEKAGEDANLKCGISIDENLGEEIRVTVIATGFLPVTETAEEAAPVRKVIDLESSRPVVQAEVKPEPRVEQQVIQPQLFVMRPVEQPVPAPVVEYTAPYVPPVVEEHRTMPIFQAEPEREKIEIDFTVAPQQISIFEQNAIAQKAAAESLRIEEEKREQLRKQAMERKTVLQSTTMWSMNAQEFKERLEVPAYMRKKVDLEDVPHSSERNISRYNLNEENELLGNNKFLHDNVD
jgi:cell division protein FtsZ